jgi:hypothetical protein
MDKRKLIKKHAVATLVTMPVITALLFYAICIGFLQVINVDRDAAICISESVSGISGIASYVVTAFWMVRNL